MFLADKYHSLLPFHHAASKNHNHRHPVKAPPRVGATVHFDASLAVRLQSLLPLPASPLTALARLADLLSITLGDAVPALAGWGDSAAVAAHLDAGVALLDACNAIAARLDRLRRRRLLSLDVNNRDKEMLGLFFVRKERGTYSNGCFYTTPDGYWKVRGRSAPIKHCGRVIAFKTSLGYYHGRPPRDHARRRCPRARRLGDSAAVAVHLDACNAIAARLDRLRRRCLLSRFALRPSPLTIRRACAVLADGEDHTAVSPPPPLPSLPFDDVHDPDDFGLRIFNE